MDNQRLFRIVVILIILLLIYSLVNKPSVGGSGGVTDAFGIGAIPDMNMINYKRFVLPAVDFDNYFACNNLNQIYG